MVKPSATGTARSLGAGLQVHPWPGAALSLAHQVSNAHGPEGVAESETCTISSMEVTGPRFESRL